MTLPLYYGIANFVTNVTTTASLTSTYDVTDPSTYDVTDPSTYDVTDPSTYDVTNPSTMTSLTPLL